MKKIISSLLVFLLLLSLSLALSLALSFSMSATASNVGTMPSKQAAVAVTKALQPDGKIRFDFKTIPAKGLKINTDGPWSLELKSHPGLELAKEKLGRAEFQDAIPGFSLLAKPAEKSGKVDFKMVVFVCTAEKTQCFRDVHQGSINWP